MQQADAEQLAALRAVVGLLGEKEQGGWWPCSFFGPGSPAFLSPVFPRTQLVAQCLGVTAAASKVHDERIGVGRVYHLFRLPEDVEQGVHVALHDPEIAGRVQQHLAGSEAAMAFLRKAAGTTPETQDNGLGPRYMGEVSALRHPENWQLVAAVYASGFDGAGEVYPYFADRK